MREVVLAARDLYSEGRGDDGMALFSAGLRGWLKSMPARSDCACIVLAGHARVGKSEVARRVAERLGCVVLSTDFLRILYGGMRDGPERFAAKLAVYRTALQIARRGVVFEGDEFTIDEPGPDGLPPNLAAVWRTGLCDCYLLGSARCQPEDKYRVLRFFQIAGRCWTIEHPTYSRAEELRMLSEKVVEFSCRMEALADQHGLPYLDLDPRRFDADAQHAAERIVAGRRSAPVAAAQPVL